MNRGRQKAEGGMMRWQSVCGFLFLSGSIIAGLAQSSEDAPPLLEPLPEIPPTFWENEAGLIGLQVFGIVLWLIFTAWLFLRPVPPVVEPIEIITRRELTKRQQCSNDDATLREIIRCFRQYLIVAFKLAVQEHTTEELCRALATNPQLDIGFTARVSNFLRRCDAAGFSSSTPLYGREVAAEALELFERGERRRVELQQATAPK